ncbi:MAG: GAF domain-containing protein [Syntrophobacteraceae bacterium]
METSNKAYFTSFLTVVKAISSTLDFEEVMGLLTRNIVEVIGLKASAIRLLNPRKRTLDLLSSYGLSDKYIQKGPVDADRSVREAMEGKVIFVLNASEDPRIQYQQNAREEGIGTILSIPLVLKSRIIGVLRLYSAGPRNFTEEEIRFAQGLADVGTIAIENARMYETLKKDYETVIGDLHSLAKEQYQQ